MKYTNDTDNQIMIIKSYNSLWGYYVADITIGALHALAQCVLPTVPQSRYGYYPHSCQYITSLKLHFNLKGGIIILILKMRKWARKG